MITSDKWTAKGGLWYCTWLSYISDSSGYKSPTQNARYTFWFNINTVMISYDIKMISQMTQ